ncbi:MAG: tRNA (N(6)-L-threonylcarbamoyladenosine(37)-C(2))-methylthiotransferase MtaB [Alphaproteobacteria bacterium]|nr:tRNA (N(6)-L-threonylcarbamoyladenosine(37)-C(2))-methylthiotransferase MtaB [Alphaproteobacteria bacterium]
MRGHAQAAGLGDAIIVNTCAVTKEAEKQARAAIRRARRENPQARIIVTGCSAQINPGQYTAMPEVDRVLGNDEKLKAEAWLPSQPESIVNDIMAVKETAHHLVQGFEDRSRAFIQVQNGCDHRCTFCIIPYGRGPSRSVPIGAIVDQVRALVGAAYNEVVFTGVDVTSYGPDLPGQPSLGQMIRRVLALVPDLPRLRLSSLDPVEIDDDLWRLIAEEPRLMPHFHLSLQAGDNMILKRMKRRHSREDVLNVCTRIRAYRPDVAFGADIIAGFPTESDAMFENTYNLVKEADLTFLHVFPYSEREGTPAARMPQVAPPIRKERAARLRALGTKQMRKFQERYCGRELLVLAERDGLARAENFLPVHLDQTASEGRLIRVRTLDIQDSKLRATALMEDHYGILAQEEQSRTGRAGRARSQADAPQGGTRAGAAYGI